MAFDDRPGTVSQGVGHSVPSCRSIASIASIAISALTALRLHLIACGFTAAALSLPASADDDGPFLSGEQLSATFAGATLIAHHWAEFYAPGGTIMGRVRYLGLVREYAGRWIAHHDRVCFEYTRPEYNTCSHFRRRGEHLHHFGADGKPKRDGISRRWLGNQLERFQ